MSLFTIFSGRPTTNPEMRQAKTGTEYISLDIAVPQYSPDGKENAMFVQCYFNKSLADRLLKAKVMKGTCLQIRGDLKANAFIYQQGEKAGQPGLNLNCYVENWEFCLSNRQNSGQDSNPGQNGNYQPNGNNQGGNYANGGGQNNHTPNGNPSGGAYAGNNGPNNRSAIGRNMNDGYSGGAPGGAVQGNNRHKTIRKLVVMTQTFRAAKPADHKILFQSAFLLSDTGSGIAIFQSTATDGADRDVITLLFRR